MTSRRAWALASAVTLALVAAAFIGRAVLSADDGADMVSDTLGFLVQGRFESASVPPEGADPHFEPTPFGSRYGLLPSLLALAFLGPIWPLRVEVGPAAVDACAALTWAAGSVLAAFAFHRLARALAPTASPLWIPGFLGGTFLWAYSADSYIEPWAAAALAWAAAELLSAPERIPFRAVLPVVAACLAAFLLRPVVWAVAPVFLLAALLTWNGRADGLRRAAWLVAGLAAGAGATLLANLGQRGSAADFGYGVRGLLPFVHDPLAGLLGYSLHPGRGVLFYAPIVLAALAMAPRLRWPVRVLCFGAPLVVALVAGRWNVWHGGSCWGPRFLIPVLPLLAAPAVLAPRRAVIALLALGSLLNFPGVLVASGAFQGYAESLVPPAGASWPKPGGDRTAEVALLTPLYGHPWLLASALAPGRLPAPWLRAGARETTPALHLSDFLSPLLARRLAGLPPVPPYLSRLLVRNSVGYLLRGRPAEASRFAEAALQLDPRVPGARAVKAEARLRRREPIP